MNDDELEKLFGNAPEDNDADKEPSSEGDVDVPSNVTIEESDGQEETESIKDSKKESKKASSKDSQDEKEAREKQAKLDAIKAEKKKQNQLERIRKIEAFERTVEEKTREMKEKRKAAGPLKNRKYLEDFPVSFKGVLAILLGVVVLLIAWSITFHPFFRVGKISVVGNYELSDDEILDELGLHYGNHMFHNYFSESNSLVSRNPYVQDISVRRKFPSTIEVSVKERKKIAYIAVPDGYIAIDDEGVVLELCADKTSEVRPLLCGLDIDSVTIGKPVPVMEDNSFRKMIIVLSAALSASEAYSGVHPVYKDYDFFGSIEEIRIIKSGMFFITVELPDETRLQVKLNNITTITDDMQWLIYAIEENAFSGLPSGVLDMTGEEYIYREYDF